MKPTGRVTRILGEYFGHGTDITIIDKCHAILSPVRALVSRDSVSKWFPRAPFLHHLYRFDLREEEWLMGGSRSKAKSTTTLIQFVVVSRIRSTRAPMKMQTTSMERPCQARPLEEARNPLPDHASAHLSVRCLAPVMLWVFAALWPASITSAWKVLSFMQFRCDDFPDALNKNKNPSFAHYDNFLLWSAASILCPYMRLWSPLRKH